MFTFDNEFLQDMYFWYGELNSQAQAHQADTVPPSYTQSQDKYF